MTRQEALDRAVRGFPEVLVAARGMPLEKWKPGRPTSSGINWLEQWLILTGRHAAIRASFHRIIAERDA